MPPHLLYADKDGNIFDHPELRLMGSAAGRFAPVDEVDCIPLPEGSELFLLPGRQPIGQDRGGKLVTLSEDPIEGGPVSAVAAFMAPAHTALYNAAYHTSPGAPNLPLFAYTAVGLYRDRFVAAGLRVDASNRQDSESFPSVNRIQTNARKLLKRFADNRLWQHLGVCALTSCCPAARNLMLGRWEAPLPTSPQCNANCLGCISYQPDGLFPITQPRLTFTPNPEEVAEVACHHFANARSPMVSFGQGCEGEPLLQPQVLESSIRLMRGRFSRETINMNSNGSRPEVVQALMDAGLSSIRVSINSLLPERHAAYYQPAGWGLEQALASLRVVKNKGGFTSINLLCMPGVNDQPYEVEALINIIEQGWVDFIQWRNINIDPEIYLRKLDIRPPASHMGMDNLIRMLKTRFPKLGHGYYNPNLQAHSAAP